MRKRSYRTPTYISWESMRHRCENPNHEKYPLYGGRGIQVCERWKEFANFLADMGERPEGTTIDRKDSKGNYTADNCRWATRKEQNNNKATNHKITYFGRTQTMAEWAVELGLDIDLLKNRFRGGWSAHRAFTEPKREYNKAS